MKTTMKRTTNITGYHKVLTEVYIDRIEATTNKALIKLNGEPGITKAGSQILGTIKSIKKIEQR